MKNRTIARVLSGVALAVLATSGAAAAAQPAAADEGIADIVVTAQKRSEPIQSVPIAISAFTSDTLARQHLDSGLDLQLLVPNLLIVGNDRPTIRGIGNNAISPTADNGTGVLFNFTPIGVRPQDEFFDVERIEVLRGPQGTLYGRNTTGGTINMITRKPGDKFEGYVTAQYGNFNTVRMQGAINLPIDPAVELRLAGFYLKRDGYTRNLATGNGNDGRDQYSWRASLRLNIDPDTRVDIVFNRSKENSSRSRENKRLCKATPVLGCSPFELGFDSPDVSGVVFQRLLAPFQGTLVPVGFNLYAGATNPANLRQVSADTDSTFVGEQNSLSAEFSHQAGPINLIGLIGFASGSSEANTDYDNAVLPFRFLVPVTYNAARGRQVTTNQLITTDSFLASGTTYYGEIRAASSFSGPFNFTAGVNFFDSQGSASFQIYHPAIELFAKNLLGLPPEAQFFNSDTPDARTKSFAAFGEIYYNLSPATKLTVGLRYTKDRKSIQTRTVFLSAPPPYTTGSGAYDALTGRVVLDHKLSPDNLLYASYSRGFKGGGLNVGNAVTPSFAPEFINAFEIGSKNSFFSNKLQANFSAFYYDYKNLQLGQRLGTSVITVNGNAKVWGLESEFVWAPVRGLLVNANASYLNTSIGDLLTIDPANPAQWTPAAGAPTRTPAVAVNLRGKELPYSPHFKFSIGAQNTMPLGETGWSATVRGDYSRQSSYFAREFNTSNDRIAAWSVANAFIRFTNQPETVSIEGFIKNIGNSDNITNSIIESDLVGSYRNARILDPKTYGVTTTFKF